MILYVNGDSHAAAAEAVNCHAFAEDDHRYFYMGRVPHPDNLAVSWGKRLSDVIKTTYKCDAESAGSNTRILRTTRQWLKDTDLSTTEVLVVIQWSTWEREEWSHNGTYYQVNSSGIDQVPDELKEQYKNFVVGVDWKQVTNQAHQTIWNFHLELTALGVKHVFLNGNNHFGNIQPEHRRYWGNSYIGPYDPSLTYDQWLKNNGFQTVAPDSWHFGQEAHTAWGRYVLQYMIQHKLIT